MGHKKNNNKENHHKENHHTEMREEELDNTVSGSETDTDTESWTADFSLLSFPDASGSYGTRGSTGRSTDEIEVEIELDRDPNPGEPAAQSSASVGLSKILTGLGLSAALAASLVSSYSMKFAAKDAAAYLTDSVFWISEIGYSAISGNGVLRFVSFLGVIQLYREGKLSFDLVLDALALITAAVDAEIGVLTSPDLASWSAEAIWGEALLTIVLCTAINKVALKTLWNRANRSSEDKLLIEQLDAIQRHLRILSLEEQEKAARDFLGDEAVNADNFSEKLSAMLIKDFREKATQFCKTHHLWEGSSKLYNLSSGLCELLILPAAAATGHSPYKLYHGDWNFPRLLAASLTLVSMVTKAAFYDSSVLSTGLLLRSSGNMLKNIYSTGLKNPLFWLAGLGAAGLFVFLSTSSAGFFEVGQHAMQAWLPEFAKTNAGLGIELLILLAGTNGNFSSAAEKIGEAFEKFRQKIMACDHPDPDRAHPDLAAVVLDKKNEIMKETSTDKTVLDKVCDYLGAEDQPPARLFGQVSQFPPQVIPAASSYVFFPSSGRRQTYLFQNPITTLFSSMGLHF